MGTGPVLGLNLATLGKTCPGSVSFLLRFWMRYEFCRQAGGLWLPLAPV